MAAPANTNGSAKSSTEDKEWIYAMILTTFSAPAMVLKTVLELDVLEIIKKAGPDAQLSPAEIVAQLPTQNPEAPSMMDRMLRLIASYSVLNCSLRTLPDGRVERLYGLAPVCKYLTKDEDGLSLASHSLFIQDEVSMECWYHLKDALLEGGSPFYKLHGTSPYAYYGTDARSNVLFNNAMADMSTLVMKKIIESYKGFEGVNTLVDMGGNRGASLSMIVSKYPHMKGINFDLPHVVTDRSDFPGITHVAGDMFVSVPQGDAIFIKNVFHDWDDEHCLKIIKNCYAALPDHGKVIACEFILPEAPDSEDVTRMAYQFDVIMMIGPNGKERTQPEFEALGKAAGFESFRVACSDYDFKIMEFIKKN